jgi:ABC-type phosphate transport system substrate-binding protein
MQDVIDGNIDIAASELPLTQQQIDDTYDIMYLPFAASALAITYHVDEVKTLTLDMPTLIGIFNGTIRYWDDSAIKATNGASATLLPHQPIVRVVRAGTSGAVYILTSAFSAVSDTWKSIYGTTGSVTWPDSNSTVTSTSSGLATKIAVTPYSIGFGDVQSLKDSPIAKLVNAAGQAVAANVASIESAATDFSLDFENRTVEIVNGIAPTSYPICMYSYLVYRGLNMSDCDKALGVYTFLTDLYSESSSFDALIQLKNSAPLDPVAKAKMLLRVRKTQCNTKVFYSEPVDNTPVTIAGITVAVVIGALVAVTIICIVVGYFWYQNYKIKKLLNHIDEGPSGFVTLFFSDIQNSTATWDACVRIFLGN